MVARDSNFANAFETVLTVEMAASDLTATVASTTGGPVSPCYLVIEPDSTERREYVYFDGTFTATTLVASTLDNRYLDGSAAASGLVHPIGSTVRSAPAAQMFEDLHDRVDGKVGAAEFTAKGDLLVGTAAGLLERVAVGVDGTVLTADASASGGVAFTAPRTPAWMPVGVLANPGFDTGDFTGWAGEASGTWAIQSAARAHAGEYGARWTATGTGSSRTGYLFAVAPIVETQVTTPVELDIDSGDPPWPRIHPGQEVYVSGWVGIGGGGHDGHIQPLVAFRNYLGAPIGSAAGSLFAGGTPLGSVQTRITLTAVAPAGTAFMIVGFRCHQEDDSQAVYYLDSCDIRVNPET